MDRAQREALQAILYGAGEMKLSEMWKSQDREKKLIQSYEMDRVNPYTKSDLAIDIVIGIVIFTAVFWLWVKA